MRLSSSLVLLPALAAAQGQIPLKEQVQGWFDKAKSFFPANVPSAVKPVVDTATQQVPAAKPLEPKPVTQVTLDNWRSVLAPVDPETPSTERELMIFVTGGNKSCFGHCQRADKAWEESLLLFSADRTSPALGRLDCEKDNLLCSIWSTGPPAVWHFDLPVKPEEGQPKQKTEIHINRLNVTTVTAEDIYKIHSEKLWQQKPEYNGAFHPTDGWLSDYGLNIVLGYLIYYISLVPSWAMMIGISFISRTMMSRRLGAPAQRRTQ
ncbi:hypothetical protein VTO42DRAFT_5012 [Malbranchea cinnamomea]